MARQSRGSNCIAAIAFPEGDRASRMYFTPETNITLGNALREL
jgi:hypothetical protein